GGQSFFSRKDSIRTIYTSLHNELKKVVATGRNALGGTAPHLEELLSHLSEQLCFFVQARMEIADFYEKMYTLSTQKFINSEELVNILESILKKYSSRFHHPILSPLESSFQLEVDVLAHLLKAQAQISEWKFLPSLVNLHSAHTKLQTWGQIFEKQRETKKHLFGGQSQKAVQPPHLFLWLMKLKTILLAKFSFYFHEALSRQTTASEMKTLTAKTNPDYFGKISSFIRKYDAVNVSLIFDNRGSESFQGHGYHHPHSYREAPKGVDQYPAVVSLPSDRPVMHWPNVIMIMTDRTSDLNSLEKVVHFYDDKVQSTYFLTRPEPHFTIVVIFESKKSERDYHFISFLNEISHSLKNSKAFASLKPGSKG
ncbi:CL066 protein, partial [Aegotheles bennettii]|nr:CL066 protein [Aegotheles bennettii]